MSADLPDLAPLRLYSRLSTSSVVVEHAIGRELLRDMFDQLGAFLDVDLRRTARAMRGRRPWVTGTESNEVFRGLCVQAQALTREARAIDAFADQVRDIWNGHLFEHFTEYIDSAIRGERDLPLGLEQAAIDWAFDIAEGLR